MKKLSVLKIIMFFIFLAAMPFVSAEWSGMDVNLTRYPYVAEGTFGTWGGSYVNVTCGTLHDGTQGNTIQQIFKDMDNNNAEDLVLLCGEDSSINNHHIIILSDDGQLLDNKVVTSSHPAGLASIFNTLIHSVADIDGDGQNEVILLNYEDKDEMSIIAYTYDYTAQDLVSYGEQIIFNGSTLIDSDGSPYQFNGDTLGDTDEFQYGLDFECFDFPESACLVSGEDIMLYTDVDPANNNSVLWGRNMTPISRYTSHPIDIDEKEYYRMNTTGCIDVIDLNDGTTNRSFCLDVVSTYTDTGTRQLSLIDCDGSNYCETTKELIMTDTASDDVAYMFSAQDGDRLFTLEFPFVSSPDKIYAWVEDRDSDGIEELCGVAIDSNSDSSWLCEKMQFFTVTKYTDYDHVMDDLPTDIDDHVSDTFFMSDIDGDSLNEFISSKMILDIDTQTILEDEVEIQAIFNGSGIVNSPLLTQGHIWDDDENGTMTLIAADTTVDQDYYMVISSVLQAEIVTPNYITFRDTPVQLIANPICQNETVDFQCTYSNGCVNDTEYDYYGMYIDCYNDGTVTEYLSLAQLRYQDYIVDCDLSSKNVTGWQQARFEVFEFESEEYNDSVILDYKIADDTDCFDQNNTGNVSVPEINLPAYFLQPPEPNKPQPFSLGQEVVFICDQDECWTDPDDDPVYLAVDCDGDSVYEERTNIFSGEIRVACTMDNLSVTQISFKVYDNINFNLPPDASYTMSVTIQNVTTSTVQETDMSAFDEIISSFSGNSIYFRLIVGLAFIIFITGGIVASINKKGVRGDALVVIGTVAFFIATILVTLIGLLPAYILLLFIVSGILFMVYKGFIGKTSGG